ncbi:YecR family lipoprotein, partial [Aeromonas dhakensis]|uniref:YecR family lipoprotein n=1 Tax=Aeromonas dhakensis TaxID=196024 RepID=UPI003BA0258A
GYHQSAVGHLSPFIHECRTYYLNSRWSATGGSKADGVIRLSYEFGQFEVPQVSEEQAILLAAKRCAVWGYTNAEAFGGITKQCNMSDGFGGCSSWIVTKEYQCTGSAAQ